MLLRHLVATVFLALLNIPSQPLVLYVGDVPLGGEPGSIDAGVLGAEDQLRLLTITSRFVKEFLRHALFGEEFVDILLPALLYINKVHGTTPLTARGFQPSRDVYVSRPVIRLLRTVRPMSAGEGGD